MGVECRPGRAGAVPPAVSGKQISWAMAGVTQMETKKPSIFGQRAQSGDPANITRNSFPPFALAAGIQHCGVSSCGTQA